MNLPQALEIVKDHIRIGKGMELTNGVPEALEMVVEELAVTQRALTLACENELCQPCLLDCSYMKCTQILAERLQYYLAQAKGGNDATERTSETP